MIYKLFLFMILVFNVIIDVVIASFRISHDVLTPKKLRSPGHIIYNFSCQSSLSLFFLTHSITFSPGTIVTYIDTDKNLLDIHVMYGKEKAKLLAHISRKIEQPLIRIFG